MKNDYAVRGDVTAIFIKRRDGSVLEALIDTDDLPIASSFPGTWTASPDGNTIYVAGGRGGPKYPRFVLHRLVLGAEKGVVVDHINGDGLDNRRANIRLCTVAENAQNRAADKDSRSGFRGVCYHNRHKRWMAYAMVNGSNHFLGYFDTPEDADATVRSFRRAAMPFSAEARETYD